MRLTVAYLSLIVFVANEMPRRDVSAHLLPISATQNYTDAREPLEFIYFAFKVQRYEVLKPISSSPFAITSILGWLDFLDFVALPVDDFGI